MPSIEGDNLTNNHMQIAKGKGPHPKAQTSILLIVRWCISWALFYGFFKFVSRWLNLQYDLRATFWNVEQMTEQVHKMIHGSLWAGTQFWTDYLLFGRLRVD